MGRHDGQAGRLAHHRRVGFDPGLDQRLHPERSVLLVRRQGDDQLAGGVLFRQLGRSGEDARHARLHVRRAPAPYSPVSDGARERGVDLGDSHRVQVAVEEKASRSASAPGAGAPASDHVEPSGGPPPPQPSGTPSPQATRRPALRSPLLRRRRPRSEGSRRACEPGPGSWPRDRRRVQFSVHRPIKCPPRRGAAVLTSWNLKERKT